MTEFNENLANAYRAMDTISLKHAPDLGVPTEIRIYGAEISAEVAEMTDVEVVEKAIQLDEISKQRGHAGQTLGSGFERFISQPPAAYANNLAAAEAWALTQLRIGVVSRRFRLEFAERFPERAAQGYEGTEEFLQGSVVAFKTMTEYLKQNAQNA